MKCIPHSDKDCNLVFDSMCIRKKILYDASEDKFLGYCDFGGIQAEAQETPATEALVFMLVGLNGKWKHPIGYYKYVGKKENLKKLLKMMVKKYQTSFLLKMIVLTFLKTIFYTILVDL